MWKVIAVNNKTNKFTLLNESGKKLYLNIPVEHKNNEEKQAYIKGHSDAYDKLHKPRKNKAVYCLSILALTEAIALLWHVILH